MKFAEHTSRKLLFSGVDLSIKPGVEHKFSFAMSKPYIKDKSVLDIGCWNGKYINLIRDAVPSLAIGIDIEEKALRVAKTRIPTSEFLVASVFNLPFKDNTFDVVTLWAVIEHIVANAELRALHEINRVLKDGGKLFLSTPNDHLLSKILDPGYFLTGHRHYSKERLTRLLNSSGFIIEDFYVKGGIFDCLSTILFYFFKYVIRRAYSIKALSRLVEREYAREIDRFNVIFLMVKKGT
ncbi:class I SAM-dependent methyltransferase [Candidatus Hakubella thermalkaliphila]|nr:class I SAM-dependent methyltransferase [Candidatus Hakubella thermalkaliphila]GFP40932.1 hypothetical protein HKBW3C_00057 [Candidatus Hakubella thermalkaliphila]